MVVMMSEGTPEQIVGVLYIVALAGFIVCVFVACILTIVAHL
jgi:hypothetical protein